MSRDLTQRLDGSLEDKVDRLIAAVQTMDSHLVGVEGRLGALEVRMGDVESRLGALEVRMGGVESRLGALEVRMGDLDGRIEGIEFRLESLEKTVENRLKETRPIWESVQEQILELKESHNRLRDEMEKGFRLIDRRLELQPIEWSRIRGHQRDLEERVDKIEKRLE